MLKAFKYFDLNGCGGVTKAEFQKALEKMGIIVPTQADLTTLFNIYDLDGSGKIDYKEFAGSVTGKQTTQSGKPLSKQISADELMDRLRQKLKTRGINGMTGLMRNFRIMDDNHSLSLDKFEFNKAMTDFQLDFIDAEILTLFNYFDINKNGLIEYDEFLRVVRGPMNAFREGIVMKAFGKMDKDNNGYLDYNDIKGVYSAKSHPDVISGKKAEQQVLQEFLRTFEQHHNVRMNDAPDNIVTKEEFIEYYSNVSCSIDDDNYFQVMMASAWKFDETKAPKQAWADNSNKKTDMQKAVQARKPQTSQQVYHTKASINQPQQQMKIVFHKPKQPVVEQQQVLAKKQNVDAIGQTSEADLLSKIQNKVRSRGCRGIMGIGRAFRIWDDNRSGSLNVDEATKAFKELRLGLAESELVLAFQMFDRNGDGSINYEEFLRTIRGEMNESRKKLCMRAFAIMDKDGSGTIDIADIKGTYNASKHPDVISGKKTEDDILFAFLDTFEQHHTPNTDANRDGNVTAAEWIEYYNNVSMSIDDDLYFDLMMNNTWNMDKSKVTKKGWGNKY